MYYLLFHHKKGQFAGQNDFAEFQAEESLLEYLRVNLLQEDSIEDVKILSAPIEFELKYNIELQPLPRTDFVEDAIENEEEKAPQKTSKEKDLEEEPTRKCSKCGGKISPWNKSGVCDACQQGKKKQKK